MARLIPRAGRHSGRKDQQVHAIQVVEEIVKEVPVHPVRQPEGEKARFPQAGGPPVRWAQGRDGPRRVVQPGGATSLRRRPTPGSPIGRGPRPRAPRRSAGTRRWRACRCPTPGPPSTPPATSRRSSDFSSSVEAARSAPRQAGPSAPSPRPPKVTGRHASKWRKEWQRRLSRTWCWSSRSGSCTECRGCSYPGTSQHHQPSCGVQPREAAVRSARPTGPVPGGRPP